MKKYFKDMETNEKVDIILNNEDLREIVSQGYYEDNMERQLEEGELMFGENWHHYIDMKDSYDTFYLRLKNWYEFIECMDKDYLCQEGLDLYNEIIELKRLYENEEDMDKYEELDEQLENKCSDLLEICENQLHDYEKYNEEDMKDWLIFNLDENDMFENYYIIDNDKTKVYQDITKCYK